ncbi:hypothetical protein [Streptosporangium sp. NPDC002524]|uniref:hypothetical protein n=1 Tax=Streptosporangium sp. NPDC002524 TaxID=3154537 RepID=UPI00332275A7
MELLVDWFTLLGQNVYWSYGDRQTSIAEMTPRDARNLLVALDRQGQAIMDVIGWQAVYHASGPYPDWIPANELAAKDATRNPRRWLALTPLVQALAEHAAPAIATGVRAVPRTSPLGVVAS